MCLTSKNWSVGLKDWDCNLDIKTQQNASQVRIYTRVQLYM